MQLMYQIDMRGETGMDAVREGLADAEEDSAAVREEAMTLALAAWAQREAADKLTTELAPDWPAHRQPPVDRAILRLAYHEMDSGHAPPRVVINEAVELAKLFGSEQSPSFINGVLDHVAKRLDEAHVVQAELPTPPVSEPPQTGDAWLNDALSAPKQDASTLASPDETTKPDSAKPSQPEGEPDVD